MESILKYLKQPSTWQGITALIAAFGVTLSPDLQAEIATVGVGIVGIIQMVRNEDKPTEDVKKAVEAANASVDTKQG